MDKTEFKLLLTSTEISQLRERKVSNDLRLCIYNFLVMRASENEFFDLTTYAKETRIVKEMIDDLESMGWKIKMSYGDTALFIFKGEVPRACW